MKEMFRLLGSLRLAVVLLAIYALVLAGATVVEKLYGAEAAQKYIYQDLWFVVLHVAIGVNVLAAMLARWPWRRRQSGFVAAHAGVLVLLVGCLLSWFWGERAELVVAEGQTEHIARTEGKDGRKLELGFQIRLHKFTRKLDPGSHMPSHYSSLVDFLDRGAPPEVLRSEELITLNAPVDFVDPESGRGYRLFQSGFDGPWRPGDAWFARLLGDARDRGHVYRTRLTVAHDPGRIWKQCGCLLILAGIVLIYWPRVVPAFGRKASASAGMIAIMTFGIGFGQNAAADELDWTAWQALPVLSEGRVAPLDSFARETVGAICGRSSPTLLLENGEQKTFSAAELLFSWLAEPARWEKIAFLPAADRQLREEALGLPMADAQGRRLYYVSPAEVQSSAALERYMAEFGRRAEAAGRGFRLSRLDRRVQKLLNAYDRYRKLTFDADAPTDTPRRFYERFRAVRAAYARLAADRQGMKRIGEDERVRRLMLAAGEAVQSLTAALHQEDFSREKVLKPTIALHTAADGLAALLLADADKPLAALAADLEHQAAEMHAALYDNGRTLRLAPALGAAALEEDRSPDDDASPWLSWRALIFGDDDLMKTYPRDKLLAARKSFAAMKAAYLDRNDPARLVRFARAADAFAAAVRDFAQNVEPLREKLPIVNRDQSLLASAGYPPPGFAAAEIFYNRLDPFYWAWMLSTAAAICLFTAFGRWRRVAFWLGAAALLGGLAMNFAGLALRWRITGLAPLTGMFETVVIVAAFVAVLGLCFALRRPRPGETIDLRRLSALAGAIIAAGTLALACFLPATAMRRDIAPAMPILRDNFWLVVHVATIMAGYAAAAFALVLANVALGFYLFGKYEMAEGREAKVLREPAACGPLSEVVYNAMKIAVFLLAAGTILGGLWADKSWGRFWGWDPKEVWALVSLLVYLAVLHARHAGWSGRFGLALAAVLGATVILVNWYGVNFILGSGLHSYGVGTGGLIPVATVVVAQWLFLAAAALRKSRLNPRRHDAAMPEKSQITAITPRT
jgi:cytochrome c-type biogenesis protein CcsB